MTRKSIELVVNTDGSLEIEAVGFAGTDCEKATAFLEKALGMVASRNRKGEYYSAVSVKKQQRAEQRV